MSDNGLLSPGSWRHRLAGLAEFARRRLAGEYEIDQFGFDPELNSAVLMPAALALYRQWFRVRMRGLDKVPGVGPARADPGCADRLLGAGELVGVFPEGFKGTGKPFSERYQLQRFGRGGFARTAVGTGVPIIPCAIVGAEEIYPMIGNSPRAARLLGLPYFPVTPMFPWLGPLGAVPLPSNWIIEFCDPVPTDGYAAGRGDGDAIAELADRVRDTIQGKLNELVAERGPAFG